MRTASLLLAALAVAPALFAGEYGLGVGASYPHPCERAASRTLNSCTPAAVVEDLRGHFISGKPFRIKAVEMAVLSGSIWIDRDALPPFNDAIVAICAAESPHDFQTLLEFLGFLPYASLRQRLESEIQVAQKKDVRARLQQALAALPKARRSR